jgi:hypothetical protein
MGKTGAVLLKRRAATAGPAARIAPAQNKPAIRTDRRRMAILTLCFRKRMERALYPRIRSKAL